MPGFHRGALALGPSHISSTHGGGRTGSAGHVARAHLMLPSVPRRARSPLTAALSDLCESSASSRFLLVLEWAVEGKAMLPQSPLLPTPVSPQGPEPAQERNSVSPAPVLGSTRCPRTPRMASILWATVLRVWGHREGSCSGVHSLWPSVSFVPTKFPQELQILSLCRAESTASPDSPSSGL